MVSLFMQLLKGRTGCLWDIISGRYSNYAFTAHFYVPLLCVYYSGIYNDKVVLMELMNMVVFPPEMNTRT